MNRYFNILWFEDELSWFTMEKRHVEPIITGHHLIPRIIRKSGDDFDVSEVSDNRYDLIIVDFQLTDTTGESIVSAIRANSVLTDTLFYSSEKDKMLTAIQKAKPPIDGIYYTERDYKVFTEKIGGLIRKIVMRSEDIVNLRGFVLDDSCDFELRVKELLNIVWHKLSDSEKGVLEKAACNNICRITKRLEKTSQKVLAETPCFPTALNEKYLFSHSDRLYLLTKVIAILQSTYGFQPKTQHTEFKTNYENDISRYRNALGHRMSCEDSIEISGQLIPVDSTLHQKMRQTLSLYDTLIRELEEFVTENM
jgi:hypothetical protein